MNEKNEETYSKTVILVGAGLTNLQVIAQAKKFHALNTQLVLLDANPFWFYPGMATEVLSGYYGLKDFHLDLRLLAKRYGIEFIQDEVTALLIQQKKVMTASGRMLEFDLISFACGTRSAAQEGDVPAEGSFPVKPLKNVLQIRNEIETCLELFKEKALDVLVLGAGLSGVEYAINIADLLRERKPESGWNVTLLEAQATVLPGLPKKAVAAAESMLRACDVVVRCESEIQHVQSNRVVLGYGKTLDFDLAVVAMGNRVIDIFIQAGLETNDAGALVVGTSLQAQNYAYLFASGECAQSKGSTRVSNLHSALQQGPVLTKNLLAYLQNKSLQQVAIRSSARRFISLGKASALLVSGSSVLGGKWVRTLKQRWDRRTLKKIRTYQI
jgi:NADH dehydrogenase FAD-containing subunit